MSVREIAKQSGKSYTTVRYWLKKKGLSTNWTPPEVDSSRCPKCKRSGLSESEFYSRGDGRTHSWCKKCANQSKVDRDRRFKESCVEYKGGECEICRYCRSMSALEFHHRDPSEKDYTISQLRSIGKVFDGRVQEELDKCHLLCNRCHREVHDGLHPEYLVRDRENEDD